MPEPFKCSECTILHLLLRCDAARLPRRQREADAAKGGGAVAAHCKEMPQQETKSTHPNSGNVIPDDPRCEPNLH
jgi:hypothetical protein